MMGATADPYMSVCIAWKECSGSIPITGSASKETRIQPPIRRKEEIGTTCPKCNKLIVPLPVLIQGDSRKFAEAVQKQYPGKLMAYNCSPSFNWKAKLDDATIAKFQRELGAMGYKFQFVTLAGFHALNNSMFELADGYRDNGMAAYSELQQREFANEARGYTATRHQREVGTGYFDQVATVISNGTSSTTALKDSTETAQFTHAA